MISEDRRGSRPPDILLDSHKVPYDRLDPTSLHKSEPHAFDVSPRPSPEFSSLSISSV